MDTPSFSKRYYKQRNLHLYKDQKQAKKHLLLKSRQFSLLDRNDEVVMLLVLDILNTLYFLPI